MEFLGGVREPESFRGGFERAQASQAGNGFCFWIVERLSDGALLGICGPRLGNEGSTTGEIEIGWRLREDAWGQGYAREAAAASLDWAWRDLACARRRHFGRGQCAKPSADGTAWHANDAGIRFRSSRYSR